jgi:hypothetical protein
MGSGSSTARRDSLASVASSSSISSMVSTVSRSGSLGAALSNGRPAEEVLSLLLPVYYVDDPPTPADLELAKDTWKQIVENRSEHFLNKMGEPGFSQSSCISLFYDAFYSRLFDIHPVRS